MWKIYGNTIISGIKHITCLVRDKNVPLFGSPITVQNVDVIGCIPSKKVINKNILKKLMENLKYSGLPEPNMLIICLGNSWNIINAIVEIIVLQETASL